MRKTLFLSIFLVCAAPAAAAESGQCDATAFTLGKPAPTAKAAKPDSDAKASVPEGSPKLAQVKPKPAAKPRLLSTCKDGKKKGA